MRLPTWMRATSAARGNFSANDVQFLDGRDHASPDYVQSHVCNATAYSSEDFEVTRPGYATSYSPTQQYLSPTQPSYTAPVASIDQTSQKTVTVVDTRQQGNPPSRGNPKVQRKLQKKLDASFFVRTKDYKKFFSVGKVFMTLWTDPVGTSNLDHSSFISNVIYGDKVFSKVRRFIVVREAEDKRSMTCLPITSYSGNGLGKAGIQLKEHGFIYSNQEPPKVSGMCSQALRVHLSSNGQDLTDPSLVNYAKIYTIETNWKVKDVGDLDSASRKLLLRYYRKVQLGDSLPDPATPQARKALLAHVGAGLDSYPAVQAHESLTAAQQAFTSTTPPSGYPSATCHESSSHTKDSSVHSYPVSTYFADCNRDYNQRSSQDTYSSATAPYYATTTYQAPASYQTPASAQRLSSYESYEAPAAPSTYYPHNPTTTNYYSQDHGPNPEAGGGSTYRNYGSQVQQWASAVSTSTYRYPTTGSGSQGYPAPSPDQRDPSLQYAYQTEGTTGSAYVRQSRYDKSAIALEDEDPDIFLPSLADSRQDKHQRSGRIRRAAASDHRRR